MALVQASQPVCEGRENNKERDGHGDEDAPRDRDLLRGAEHVVRLRPSVSGRRASPTDTTAPSLSPLIDCEENRTLRAVLVGMLREAER
jgi:hypothetical protein